MGILPAAAKTTLVVLAAMIFSGCLTGPETVDLAAHKAKWKKTEPAAYQYHVKRFCECWPEDVEVWATRDSVIRIREIGAESQSPNLHRQDFSIDSLFAEVERALAQEYVTRKVSFNEAYGFPESVYIDFDKQIADEEYSLVISDFGILDARAGAGP
jgi:hypothetical protein